MYAIIALWWHQRLIQENQEIVVDRVEGDVGSSFDIADVLATFASTEDSVVVWTPYVQGAKVRVKILAHEQGDKLHIVKIENKKRYRRKIGFRPQQTILLIEKITP
jgi:large subunit ribosomal protein L21